MSDRSVVPTQTWALAGAITLVGLFHIYLFYPGTMDWDSAGIAKMAANGEYTDWFLPTYIFLWSVTDRIAPNPGVIWLLQEPLLLGGAFMLGLSLLRLGRSTLSVALVAGLILLPIGHLELPGFWRDGWSGWPRAA